MTIRLIYIPRDRADADTKDQGNAPSLLAQAEKWRSRLEARQHVFKIVCRGENFEGNPADGGADNQIYVYGGHGLAGYNGAGWPGDPGTSGSVVVPAREIAEQISDRGWAPSLFTGRLKVYSCFSGNPGSSVAFAALVANEMRTRGWTNCTFWGYLTKISQVHQTLNGVKAGLIASYMAKNDDSIDEAALKQELIGQEHRWATVGDRQMPIGRVSAQRVEF